MNTVAIVNNLPKCDFCSDTAAFDGKTKLGPWGYMCATHMNRFGSGVGLGKGQQLVLAEQPMDAEALLRHNLGAVDA